MGVFATQNISPFDEITIDYKWEESLDCVGFRWVASRAAHSRPLLAGVVDRCACLAPKCRGWLGTRPKVTEAPSSAGTRLQSHYVCLC